MVGQVPGSSSFSWLDIVCAYTFAGLSKMSVNPPLAETAMRAKGYDMGLVAVLDKPETVSVYAQHPAHQA